MDDNSNELEKGLENANKINGAVKTGKAIANISKGASAGGPYGAVATLLWQNKNTVAKVLVVAGFLMLLPILFILMLPSIIFNGLLNPGTTDILNNDMAIRQNINEAQAIVSEILITSHLDVLSQINEEIANLGENEKGKIIDAYADGSSENVFILLSQYSAYKNDYKEINLKDLEKTLKNNSSNLYYYTTSVSTSTSEVYDSTSDTTSQIEITTYTYTIQYKGIDYFNNLFNLDEKQNKYATEYANNLMIYLYGTNTISQISPEVYKFDLLVRKYAEIYGVTDYIEIIYAVMMTESGGRVVDVMQSSECEFNTRYPRVPNGITDTEYSIDVGIRYFAKCLQIAECTDINDINKMTLALQGYNFGAGYITWAKNKYGSYSESNAIEFSNIQKAKLGVSVYGNTKYVSKVMSYYYPSSGTDGFAPPFVIPNWKTYITSEFGMRINPTTGEYKHHDGMDIGLPLNTPILSVNDGVVISTNMGTGYGNSLLIDHGNGIVSGYAHCSELLVSNGQTIRKGQIIALVGSTGDSTGPHLHLEIRVNGSKVNPRNYIK